MSDRVTSPILEPDFSVAYARQRVKDLMDDDMLHTPFLQRLANHIDIDDSCRAYVRELQTRPTFYREGEDVIRTDTPASDIFVVQMGWLVGYTYLPNGSRHIHRIYMPGDFVAIEDINWNYRSANVTTVTPVVLTRFTKLQLRRMFSESPRLSRTLFSIVAMTQVQTFDLQKAVARQGAELRVADLLLGLYSRAKASRTLIDGTTMVQPLNQTEIGDAIGLTNVSVSRAMTSLKERGYIERSPNRVRFLRMETMIEECGFTDRWEMIDREWIGLAAEHPSSEVA